MDKSYVKLKDLVNGTFTIIKVEGYKFKLWDNENKKMLVEDNFFKKNDDNARKIYGVETDKGFLDLSEWQLNTLLGVVQYQGKADVNGRIFRVKSNGKSGMEIRYYFDVVEDRQTDRPSSEPTPIKDVVLTDEDVEKPVDMSDIPF